MPQTGSMTRRRSAGAVRDGGMLVWVILAHHGFVRLENHTPWGI